MASNDPPVCGICDQRKISRPAIIWCNQCDEGLCGDCRDHHGISKASRKHDTITIADYQHLPTDVVNVKQTCAKHDDNFIMFCRIHDCPCCKRCITNDHTKCDDVADINDVIGNVKSSSLFQEVERSLEYVAETLKKVVTSRNENIDELKKKRKIIEEQLKNLRRDIQSYLDKLHGKLVRALVETEQKTINGIKEHIVNLEANRKEVLREQENFAQMKAYASDLQAFVFVKKMEDRVATKTKFLGSLKQQNILDEVSISLNLEPTLKDFTKSITSFGKITVKRDPTEMSLEQYSRAQILTPLPLRSTERVTLSLEKTINTERSMITGSTILSNNRIGICCNSPWYCCIILMNTDGVIDTEIKVSSGCEYDIAYHENDSTIIATRNFQGMAGLTVIDANDGIEKKSIDFNNSVDLGLGGVAIQNGTAICCSNVGILKVELSGGPESSIITDNTLNYDCYVASNEKNIYFTNTKTTGTVTCCDFLGNIKWVFKDDKFKCPSGVCVDNDGNVYVAGYQTDNVVVISPDGKSCKELLTKENGIDKPRALSFDKKGNKLLVANNLNKYAFLFKVSN